MKPHPLAWAVLAATSGAAFAQQTGAQTAETVPETAQAAATSDSIALPTIAITGDLMELATGPVDGFVVTTSASAGKSAAPLVETPASVSIVSAADIAARGGVQNVGAAIAYTPGIWVDPAFNATTDSGFNIRGFSSWGSNYLDGLKVGTGMTRSGQPSIEPYGMERIEVLRSPPRCCTARSAPADSSTPSASARPSTPGARLWCRSAPTTSFRAPST